jgi:hypothetical protein
VAPSSGSSGATVAQTLTMFDTPSNGAATPKVEAKLSIRPIKHFTNLDCFIVVIKKLR